MTKANKATAAVASRRTAQTARAVVLVPAVELVTVEQHNKRAKGVSLAVSQGVSQGVSLEGCHIEQSDTVFIRYLNSGVSAVATERLPMGVDLSAMSRFSAKVIQFPQRQRMARAFDLHGKASLSSASFDDVNAELRAACDEPAFSMAARSVA